MSSSEAPFSFQQATASHALSADLNVRVFSCDSVRSLWAATEFLKCLPADRGNCGVIIEGFDVNASDFREVLDTLTRRGRLYYCATDLRLFFQCDHAEIYSVLPSLPSPVAWELFGALRGSANQLDNETPTAVMGILNVTPDSFSDGGKWVDTSAAADRALQMYEEGAAFIDIGGESSRPGAADVSVEEEISRVLPVIQRLHGQVDAHISVDTRKAEVARACLEAGAAMINDVSGLTYDPSLGEVVAQFPHARLVLMHQRRKPSDETYSTEYDAAGKPVYEDVVADTMRWLRTQAMSAVRSGVRPEQLWIDPGFGFGKTYEQNIELLRRIREYTSIGLPILLGTSRKSSVGRLQGGGEPDDRLEGSLATACWAVSQGVRAVRVHDVRETVRAVRAADALRPRVL